MPPRYPVKQLFPAQTHYEAIALEAVQSPVLQQGVEYWHQLRGARRFARREDLDPRKVSQALSNMILVRVVDAGDDFEFRIVGDEVRRAYPISLSNRLMSDIADDLPELASKLSIAYRRVIDSRLPFAVRTFVGLDNPDVNFSYAEAVHLPFGATDDVVDHLLTLAAHRLEIA
jgi:hypothetical protein